MASLVFLGLSLSSSWGNGHATTYRALLKALARRGHAVTFLERNVPWYRDHRDLEAPDYCALQFYQDLDDLKNLAPAVAEADAVIVGSFVPDGIAVGDWVLATARGRVAFYDIDTPETLAALERGTCEYVNGEQIARYPLYLSFTGGPTLERLRAMGSPRAAPLYCSVDPDAHRPITTPSRWTLGYLGTYSPDRQGSLEELLLGPARALPRENFVVAGAQYPDDITWPANVEYIPHLPPINHAEFYSAQRYALNLTRQAMRRLGWSPSVRLFEAAACGTPIISDEWAGLDSFFTPGKEILVAADTDQVITLIKSQTDAARERLAEAARRRVLASHTADHRATELEQLLQADSRRIRGSRKYAWNV